MKPHRIPIHGLNDYAEAGEEVEGIYIGRFRDTINRLPRTARRAALSSVEALPVRGSDLSLQS